MSDKAVAYFSVYETTKAVAEEIARQTGAELIEIVPEVPYDGDRDHYDELAAYAKREHDEDMRPAIANAIDLSAYSTVFVGYPMWWYTMPMVMYTFFENTDLAGKTVVPFNTHMGSRDGGTYAIVRELCPDSTVLDGLPVEMRTAEAGSAKVVAKWLSEIGIA